MRKSKIPLPSSNNPTDVDDKISNRFRPSRRLKQCNELAQFALQKTTIEVERLRQSNELAQFALRKTTIEADREVALQRLVHLLEINTFEYTHQHVQTALELENDQELSRMARLSAAHAAYALADGSKMRRINPGAWLHERHVGENPSSEKIQNSFTSDAALKLTDEYAPILEALNAIGHKLNGRLDTLNASMTDLLDEIRVDGNITIVEEHL